MYMNIKNKFHLIVILVGVISSASAWAQSNTDDLEVINLEDLYKKQDTNTATPEATSPSRATVIEPTNEPEESVRAEMTPTKKEEARLNELKDLNQMVPFSEISVIQKKYLPKTERFEFYVGLGLTTNTPWFLNYGGKLDLSYNFTEIFGIGISTLFLTSSERQVAKEIHDNNGLTADQFIYTKGYYGLDLKFSPVYGKISYLNENIINYEMYFSLGGGISSTNSQEKDVPTVHLATGQIFAISKSMAFRWDYSINLFQATPVGTSTSGAAMEKNLYNDFVLTAGLSFFFPEAGYR